MSNKGPETTPPIPMREALNVQEHLDALIDNRDAVKAALARRLNKMFQFRGGEAVADMLDECGHLFDMVDLMSSHILEAIYYLAYPYFSGKTSVFFAGNEFNAAHVIENLLKIPLRDLRLRILKTIILITKAKLDSPGSKNSFQVGQYLDTLERVVDDIP